MYTRIVRTVLILASIAVGLSLGAQEPGLLRLTNDANFDQYPAWSPDGKSIVFVSSTSGDQNPDVWSISPSGSSLQQITTGVHGYFGGGIQNPAWLGTTGDLIVLDTVYYWEWDRLTLSANPTLPVSHYQANGTIPNFQRLLFVPGGLGGQWLAVSPDGSTVAWSALTSFTGQCPSHTDLHVAPLTSLSGQNNNTYGKIIASFDLNCSIGNMESVAGISFSPDGTQLAVGTLADSNHYAFDIDIYTIDGTLVRKLTTSGGSKYTVNWRPNWSSGNRIAFSSNSTGRFEIWTINADGSDLRQVTTMGGEMPSWSPDASKIAFASSRGGSPQIYSMDAGGSVTLGQLAALQATKLWRDGGLYGFGGKGYDYSGFKNLAVAGLSSNLSSQNLCEVNGGSGAVAPCWIVPDAIRDTNLGYAYHASNTGNASQSGGSAAATQCVGSGTVPCLDLKGQPENDANLHYDFGLDCSGLVMWSYNTAAGATTQKPGDKSLPISQEGAGVSGEVIRSISRQSGVVTVRISSQGDKQTVNARAGLTAINFATGDLVRIEGVRDRSFNGAFPITVDPTQANTFTYEQQGQDVVSSWGVATNVSTSSGKPTPNTDQRYGQCGDDQSVLITNDLGDLTSALTLDLNQMITYRAPEIMPGDIMCFRIYSISSGTDINTGKRVFSSGHVAMYVGNGSTVEAYQRPDGVLSGHVNSRSGTDLGRALEDPKGVTNCLLTWLKPDGSKRAFCFDFLGYRRPKAATNSVSQTAIAFQTHSPISLSVTDPAGSTVTSESWINTTHEAYRKAGSLSYYDYSSDGDDVVFSPVLEAGQYYIQVIPKPNAPSDDTYSLTATVGSNTMSLAQDVPISQIPQLGYGVQSNGSDVVPFIPVSIAIKPGSSPSPITTKSMGKIPVAILSTAQFDAVAQVVPSTLRFGRSGNEASLAFCDSSGVDVNGDGIPDLLCHFNAHLTDFGIGDTQGILTGLTGSNELIRGTGGIVIVPR